VILEFVTKPSMGCLIKQGQPPARFGKRFKNSLLMYTYKVSSMERVKPNRMDVLVKPRLIA
jgi:hypothetical protein